MWVSLIIAIMCLSGLDSFSTYLALKKLPPELRAEESNGLMLKLMNKSQLASELVKQPLTLALVLWMYFTNNLYGLELITALLGLVVFGNFYIYIGRRITHKKIRSPYYKAFKLVHLPDKWYFWTMMPLLLLIAIEIVRVVNL